MGLNRNITGLNRNVMGLNRSVMGLNRSVIGLNFRRIFKYQGDIDDRFSYSYFFFRWPALTG